MLLGLAKLRYHVCFKGKNKHDRTLHQALLLLGCKNYVCNTLYLYLSRCICPPGWEDREAYQRGETRETGQEQAQNTKARTMNCLEMNFIADRKERSKYVSRSVQMPQQAVSVV